MRIILIAACVLFAASAVIGAELCKDEKGVKIQAFCPDSKKESANLTIARTVKNHTNNIIWSLYAPVNCVFRVQTTATLRGYNRTYVAENYLIRAKHLNGNFVSYSGCTNGEVQSQ